VEVVKRRHQQSQGQLRGRVAFDIVTRRRPSDLGGRGPPKPVRDVLAAALKSPAA